MSEIHRTGERVTSAANSSCLKISDLQMFRTVPALRFHFGQKQERLWDCLIWEQKYRTQKRELRDSAEGGGHVTHKGRSSCAKHINPQGKMTLLEAGVGKLLSAKFAPCL